jgi:hypothetical protein
MEGCQGRQKAHFHWPGWPTMVQSRHCRCIHTVSVQKSLLSRRWWRSWCSRKLNAVTIGALCRSCASGVNCGKRWSYLMTPCRITPRYARRPAGCCGKKSCADLLNATLAQARSLGLLADPQSDKTRKDGVLASIDSTGLETRHVSDHYRRRTGKKHRRFPKLAEVIEVKSHLAISCWCGRGPAPDQPHLRGAVQEALGRHRFSALAADAGYDGEDHHRYLYERLGVIGVIKPGAGRPAHDPQHVPGGFYRSFLHKHWPKNLYGQRSQSECRISMEKRRLGSALTARKRSTQDQQMRLRVITLNFMINAGVQDPP